MIQLIESNVSIINIPDRACNDIDYTIFDFSRFTQVESIEIGNDCFGFVETFQIDGLNRLKSLKIGNNSFTQTKRIMWVENFENAKALSNNISKSFHILNCTMIKCGTRDDKSKSFHILNCESLEFIHIGEWSFSDYGGEFELKNLPSLQSIEIGTIGSNSFNFCFSSFVIRGIELILNIEFV